MHIHPAIQALQGDPALQAKAQQAAHDGMFAWVDGPERRQLRAELDAFAARRPIADCPLLARLFAQGDRTARDLATSFADAGIAILADEPFAHLPQRLAAGAPARHAAFWPGESWEHVLAGEAVADLVDCHPRAEDGPETGAVALHAREVLLTPGAVIARDADRQAMLLRSVPRSLVTLRLQRRLLVLVQLLVLVPLLQLRLVLVLVQRLRLRLVLVQLQLERRLLRQRYFQKY